MGNEFEHRVVTHRHANKMHSKNCDALPLKCDAAELRRRIATSDYYADKVRRKCGDVLRGFGACAALGDSRGTHRKYSALSSFYFLAVDAQDACARCLNSRPR
jgi:hypothetical protein